MGVVLSRCISALIKLALPGIGVLASGVDEGLLAVVLISGSKGDSSNCSTSCGDWVEGGFVLYH